MIFTLLIIIVALLILETIVSQPPEQLDFENKNFYSILNLSLSSSQDDIKRSYRQLALIYHPDKYIKLSLNDSSKETYRKYFIIIQQAYETLCDPLKKAIYDLDLTDGSTKDNDKHYNFGHQIKDRYHSGDFSTVIRTKRFNFAFQAFFSKPKIREIYLEFNVSLEKALHGGEMNITYFYQRKCSACNGTGAEGGDCSTCPLCLGTGIAKHLFTTCEDLNECRNRVGYTQITTTRCVHCKGRGCIMKKKCPICRGSGLESTEGWLLVTIPPRFSNGQEFVYPSMGHDSIDGSSGDVVVRLLYFIPEGYRVDNTSVGTGLDLILEHKLNVDNQLLQIGLSLNLSTPIGELLQVYHIILPITPHYLF